MAVAEQSRRLTAEERREQVLAAALHEFGARGYHAAGTPAIAKRAGISQPYIYALFPSKRDLFLAVHERVLESIRHAFVTAARGARTSEEALEQMGLAYGPLVTENPDLLLCQLQAYAAAGDPEIGPAVAAGFKDLAREVGRISGAAEDEVARFLAAGMLINVTTALGVPELVRPMLTSECGL